MSTETEPRTTAYAGRVADAVRILATRSTLADHVTVYDDDPLRVEITDEIPYDLWGSGTRGLWRLLCAIAYSADTVSLYDIAGPLDSANGAVAAEAVSALFGARR